MGRKGLKLGRRGLGRFKRRGAPLQGMLEVAVLALLLALPFSLLGLFVVLRNESFATVGLSHAAFGGAALGLLFSLPAFPTALAYAIAIALLLHHFSHSSNRDAVIGVAFAFSMALGILAVHLSQSYSDAFSLLFGSLLAFTEEKAGLLALLGLLLAWLWRRWKELYYASFDEEFWMAKGRDVRGLEREFLMALAGAVVVGMKLVGALLVSAFLVIPPTIALLFRRPIGTTMALSSAVAAFSAVAGVAISYAMDLPPGAVVVVLLSLLYPLAHWVRQWL